MTGRFDVVIKNFQELQDNDSKTGLRPVNPSLNCHWHTVCPNDSQKTMIHK